MNTKIIILTGKAQSGKDTACSYIRSFLKGKGYSSKIYPFADSLKHICTNVLGLEYNQCWGENSDKNTPTRFKWSDLPIGTTDLAKLLQNRYNVKSDDYMTARDVMQVFGTNIFRSFYKDCWVQATIKKIKEENLDFALISDARFPNEIDYATFYGPIVIQLTRNALDNKHESETALDNYSFANIKKFHKIINDEMSMDEKNNAIKKVLEQYL
jgi:hypothetical protein